VIHTQNWILVSNQTHNAFEEVLPDMHMKYTVPTMDSKMGIEENLIFTQNKMLRHYT
jgi:hypothetical protein